MANIVVAAWSILHSPGYAGGARDDMGIGRRIRLGLQAFGVDICRYKPLSDEQARFARVLQAASIDLILDVGANAGTFAAETRKCGYRGQIISFEPLEDAYRVLLARTAQDPYWQVAPRLALGRKAGEAVIHVSANSVSSSLLPMAEAHANALPESRYIREEKILVRRLDDVAKELAPDIGSKALMLKIDAQGYELPILEGSRALLDHTSIVQVELSLTELYEGQALIWDVVEFLSRFGFELWMMSEVFVDWQTGRLLQVDGVFIKKGLFASAKIEIPAEQTGPSFHK